MLSRLMTRKEQAVLLAFAAAIALGAAVLFMSRTAPDAAIRIEPATADALAPPVPAAPVGPAAVPSGQATPLESPPLPARVVVSVQGAVSTPGVYTLSEGDRVQDLLRAAGGMLESANITNINLAARLVDGTTLIVPSWTNNDSWSYQASANPPHYTIQQQAAPIAAVPGPAADDIHDPARTAARVGALINLNTASQAQLESLPGIGPTYAQEIIRFREHSPFRTIDDVMQVRGIGPKRLESIRPLVTVE